MAHDAPGGTPQPNGRERVDAQVAGQTFAISTNNLIAILFVGMIGVLLWMFWGRGQALLERDIAERARIAATAREDVETLQRAHAALLLRLEEYHEAEMARQLEVARGVLRLLLSIDFNIRHVGEPEELPLGTLPPWFTPQPPLPPPR